MKSSAELFKKSLDKAYSQPGMQLNQSTLADNMKYKQSFKEEKIEGGLADKKTLKDIAKKHDKKGYYHIDDMIDSLKKQLAMGMKVEMEHTKDKSKAKEIAMDHLWEDPNYYTKLKKIESNEQEATEATGTGSSGAYSGPLFGGESKFLKKSRSETPKLKEGLDVDGGVEKVEATEATTSGSVGGYESPSMWAKSTKKKDWGPSRKTQIPGGSFVKVKKKCTKFPYCNQGDINALSITKNESVKEAIKNISKKYNISENVIINILEEEFNKTKKGKK